MASKSSTDVIKAIKDSPNQKVKVAVTDLDGVLRGKYLHKDKFLSAADGGFGFCNVVFGWDAADLVYDNCNYTGWHTGYPDALVELDLSTHRKVPWDNGVDFFLGHFVQPQGQPLAVCPRQLLQQVIGQAEAMGMKAFCGLEFEWFNFRETPQSWAEKHYVQPKPLTPGMFGYSLLRSGLNRPYFNALMDQLLEFGVPLEGLHTETGPGVYEAAIQASDALEAADRAVLFKTSVKEIAYGFEIMPSFMAKWHPTLPGCSGHIHQSLWDMAGKNNLFHDPTNSNGMSETFQHFLAGQMRCLPEILPMYAPNVNSYKRLVEGLWAPTRVTWGVDNRTTALRVIPGSAKSTRLETRVPGADINPYLAVAAALASGLYGIKNKLPLEVPPVEGNAYEKEDTIKLPSSLYKAASVMAGSHLARELFGSEFVDHFVASRHWEWRQFHQSVTDWELQRYFEII